MKNKFPNNWEWQSSASGNTLLILLALARFSKKYEAGLYYTGSAADLARHTKLNVRTAQRAIKQLVNTGVITKGDDNMSLTKNMIVVKTATICRLLNKESDNMSQENLSPNEYNNPDIHTIYNSNPLSKGQIDYIRGKFKNIDVDLEVEKFKDYWSSKPEPKTWSGYRRLLTWLDKAERQNNERFKGNRFSRGQATPVTNQIDERTRAIAERQRKLREAKM